MRAPQPGETVHLLCKKCQYTFTGSCPHGLGIGLITEKMKDDTKCPKCGSKRLVLSPWVNY